MFRDPPEKLVNSGEVEYGLFARPVPVINADDYIYLDEMDRKIGGLKKKLLVHSFNYFGVVSERFIIGLAVFDLKCLGGFFLYVFDFFIHLINVICYLFLLF
jgi:hypothetical protein